MFGKIPRADGYLDTGLENLDGNDEFRYTYAKNINISYSGIMLAASVNSHELRHKEFADMTCTDKDAAYKTYYNNSMSYYVYSSNMEEPVNYNDDEFHAMKAGEASASVESSKDWSKDGLNW